MPPLWVVAPDIAARIAELRTRLGESQEVFAKRFGRERKQVSQWENGRQAPRRRDLERAASANGWPVEVFADHGPRPSEIPLPVPQRPSGTRSPDERVSGPDLARLEALQKRLRLFKLQLQGYAEGEQRPGPAVIAEWLELLADLEDAKNG